MAAFKTNYSDARRAKYQRLHSTLELSPFEQLPKCLSKAGENALKLERTHQKFRQVIQNNPFLDDRQFMKAFKAACPQQKKRTHRIKFGEVIVGEEKKEIKFTPSPKELLSGPILEKFPGSPRDRKYGVLHLMMYNKEVWSGLIGGTPQSFIRECGKANIPVQVVVRDLKMLYKKHFLKLLPAILGYRSSWKFKPFYSEQIWSAHFGRFIESGRKLPISTNLRFYLISVIKDPEIAAISIQTAWRRKRAMKSIKRLVWRRAILRELEKGIKN